MRKDILMLQKELLESEKNTQIIKELILKEESLPPERRLANVIHNRKCMCDGECNYNFTVNKNIQMHITYAEMLIGRLGYEGALEIVNLIV